MASLLLPVSACFIYAGQESSTHKTLAEITGSALIATGAGPIKRWMDDPETVPPYGQVLYIGGLLLGAVISIKFYLDFLTSETRDGSDAALFVIPGGPFSAGILLGTAFTEILELLERRGNRNGSTPPTHELTRPLMPENEPIV
jgi:hypothetical protein